MRCRIRAAAPARFVLRVTAVASAVLLASTSFCFAVAEDADAADNGAAAPEAAGPDGDAQAAPGPGRPTRP
jgi:hypothetical protein